MLDMDTYRVPVSLCILVTLFFGLLTNFVHTASLELPADIQKRSFDTELDESSDNSEAWQMIKTAELQRELAILDEAESRVIDQLQALREQQAQIVEKKRGHRQCLVNLVACYKKRK